MKEEERIANKRKKKGEENVVNSKFSQSLGREKQLSRAHRTHSVYLSVALPKRRLFDMSSSTYT
jgi:hypothetical protein